MKATPKIPHWAQYGGPFSRLYRNGRWFFYLRPQYGEGRRWGLGHRMGGFWLAEIGSIRIGKTR